MRIQPNPPDIQELLDLERDFPPEPDDRKGRVWAAIAPTLGLPLPGPDGGGSGGGGSGGGGSASGPEPTPAPPSDAGASAAGTGAASAAGTGAATAAGTGAATAGAVGSGVAASGLGKLLVVGAAIYIGGIATGAAIYHVARVDQSGAEILDERTELALEDDAAPTHSVDADHEQEIDEAPVAQAFDAETRILLANELKIEKQSPIKTEAPGNERIKRLAPDAERAPDDIARERRLIEVARAATARGNARTALDAVTRHAEQFPSGQLTEEREAIRVLALLAAGRVGTARQWANVFKRRYPNSLFLRSIERELARRRPPAKDASP